MTKFDVMEGLEWNPKTHLYVPVKRGPGDRCYPKSARNAQIVEQADSGMTKAEIGRQHGISHTRVANILQRERERRE